MTNTTWNEEITLPIDCATGDLNLFSQAMDAGATAIRSTEWYARNPQMDGSRSLEEIACDLTYTTDPDEVSYLIDELYDIASNGDWRVLITIGDFKPDGF